MRKLLFVFLTACGAQMQRPIDLLGNDTVCRPANEGQEICIDRYDAVWDCRYAIGEGWTCYLQRR